MAEPRYVRDAEYDGHCRVCGSDRWVSVSFNGGTTRVPQCVPCGAVHRGVVLVDAPQRNEETHG
jgi:hypothetical protein